MTEQAANEREAMRIGEIKSLMEAAYIEGLDVTQWREEAMQARDEARLWKEESERLRDEISFNQQQWYRDESLLERLQAEPNPFVPSANPNPNLNLNPNRAPHLLGDAVGAKRRGSWLG